MSARSTLFRLAAALTLAACAKPAEQAGMAAPAVDSAAVVAAIGDFWQRWTTADTSNNLDAALAMIADSARIDIRGMAPIMGRAGWKAVAEPMMKTTKTTSLMVMPDETVPVTNELVYQSGSYMEGTTTGGKRMMEHGRYATAIRKEADGQWRMSYIMVFADSTLPVKK